MAAAKQRVVARGALASALPQVRRIARSLRPLDGAMAGIVAIDAVGSLVAARLALGWRSAAALDLLLCVYLLAPLARPAWRPVVGRLLALGLIAGMLELVTDAAGQAVVHSLVYPAGGPMLAASPLYMPLSWMIVLSPLAYFAWRLADAAPRVSTGAAMLIVGGWSALNIPFYEQLAYAANWWRYTTALRLGHTPLYVVLFEGLIGAALPPLARGLPALEWRGLVLRGALLGVWIGCAALLAWLLLGWQ